MTDKILKSEQLSEEELNQVAGGTFKESYSDAQAFEKLGVKIFENKLAGVGLLDHEGFVNLRNAFNKYGVTIKDDGSAEVCHNNRHHRSHGDDGAEHLLKSLRPSAQNLLG